MNKLQVRTKENIENLILQQPNRTQQTIVTSILLTMDKQQEKSNTERQLKLNKPGGGHPLQVIIAYPTHY